MVINLTLSLPTPGIIIITNKSKNLQKEEGVHVNEFLR